MKFNYKSRKGFTLIELLVVIGILTVLAAIAIPSVAGLIDRANVSADNTNANEMTNAMERFVSEYELFRQDIANGTFDVNNMDAAQGRVYNVTGADSIEDIRALESEAGFNGIRIDLDNKYAQNHATAKAVIENYMKTSSSTFEPKQSDMTYWYNTVTGYTVVAEKDINTSKLYDLLPTDVRYNNSQPASVSEWIDLSSNIIIPDISIINAKQYEGPNNVDLIYTFSIPNPKYFDYELSKIHFMFHSANNGELNIETAKSGDTLDKVLDADMLNKIHNSNEQRIIVDTTWGTNNEHTHKLIRLAFEYEEDGVTKYVYSAVVDTEVQVN